MKLLNSQIGEFQQTPSRENIKKLIPRYAIMKLLETSE